jgi:PAS domain S-box-containing protein
MSNEDLDFVGSVRDATHLRRAYDVRGASLGGGRLVLSWREITERKRTEIERRMQSRVLDMAGEGVCLARASDSVIVYANPRFAEMFGYEPGELDGRPASVLAWEQQPGETERRAQEIVELGRSGGARFQVHGRRKDGTPVWTEAHLTAFEDPAHGKVWATVEEEVAKLEELPDSQPAGGRFARAGANGQKRG